MKRQALRMVLLAGLLPGLLSTAPALAQQPAAPAAAAKPTTPAAPAAAAKPPVAINPQTAALAEKRSVWRKRISTRKRSSCSAMRTGSIAIRAGSYNVGVLYDRMANCDEAAFSIAPHCLARVCCRRT